jgi:hypothetical protein
MSGKNTVRLMLRLPTELHQRLTDSASARHPRISLNSEIIERLLFSYKSEFEPAEPPDLEARLAVVERFLFGERKENEGDS